MTTSARDYSEYWGVQVQLVRILQKLGVVVDIKGRLPLFRLWIKINTMMTGDRRKNILSLIQALVNMRIKGMEPPFEGSKYL